MSPSEVHASVRRARAARLIYGPELGDRPNIQALEEFLVHGVKYAFPAERGGMTRGLPTGSAAEPLSREITQEDPVPVWPFEEGPDAAMRFRRFIRAFRVRLSRIPSCTNFSRL